jgi:transposase-like protein
MIYRAPRIPPKKRASLFKCFSMDLMATDAAKIAKVNHKTADLYYRYYREQITRSMRRVPRFFGEIEMDQSFFGGRGRKRMESLLKRYAKVMPRAQYLERAKAIRQEYKTPVFGILQRGGDVYVQIIKKSDKRTLEPIVRMVVEQGSTIFTDKWRGFADLGLDGYTHKSINHSVEYSDRKGTHINGIESFWSFASRRLAKFNGIAKTTLPLHLRECAFRYNHKDVGKALKAILKD